MDPLEFLKSVAVFVERNRNPSSSTAHEERVSERVNTSIDVLDTTISRAEWRNFGSEGDHSSIGWPSVTRRAKANDVPIRASPLVLSRANPRATNSCRSTAVTLGSRNTRANARPTVRSVGHLSCDRAGISKFVSKIERLGSGYGVGTHYHPVAGFARNMVTVTTGGFV